MKKYLRIKLIYIFLILTLSFFAFYLTFKSIANYNFPYHQLEKEKGEILHVIKSKKEKESLKITLKLKTGKEIILFEGIGESYFNLLNSKLENKELICRYNKKFLEKNKIYNPNELIVDGKTIINYQKRQNAEFKFIFFILSFAILFLLVAFYLISAIIYVGENRENTNATIKSKRIIGNWFFS